MINVVWWTEAENTIPRGYWDQGWLEAFFSGALWRSSLEFHHRGDFPDSGGAIVVVPARWHADHLGSIQDQIERLDWVLLILTGDEEGDFDDSTISHPNMEVWKQTPPVGWEGHRPIGDFWPPDCPAILSELPHEKTEDWFFAGQVNTPARRELAETLERLRGEAVLTDAFGSGLAYPEYLERMSRAKVIPCPAGPFTPDTFRLYEALEAGCIPVVEETAKNRPDPGYWKMLLGEVPFPVVTEWRDFPKLLERISWPADANRLSAWWQGYKRDLAYTLREDLCRLSGEAPLDGLGEKVTVLIPTSPCSTNPDTSVIEATLDSLSELSACDKIVMLDGPSSPQYEEYRRRVTWLCEHRWPNTIPLYFGEHTHQAAMTRRALGLVRSPLVLFVEHDAPIEGPVPWAQLAEVVESDRADLIRLHHEAVIQEDHVHMMLDASPRVIEGVPLLRTVQWSQRPHLASTRFYRRLAEEYFGARSRTMIEDVMHGVVHTHWREFGLAGWDRFRLFIYAPEGSIKRSGHLDARGNSPHRENVFAYDGPTPFGAPAPNGGGRG